MVRRSDGFGPYFPESKPIPVEGGIVTSKQRGQMADTWWSKRFIDVLQSYGLGGRMARGRRYARAGQVLSLEVAAGSIKAQVQGSRQRPYSVEVRHTPPTEAQWRTIDQAFSQHIGLAAEMMAGSVPTEVEQLFDDAGSALFPRSWRSLRAVCSCPDWGDPCKHTAAVLYVFADMLDSDPWVLLAWHGRSREDVLERLRIAGANSLNEMGGLPPWWPLSPSDSDTESRSNASHIRMVVPAAMAPEPPDAALARCEPMSLELRARNVGEILGSAYESLVAPNPNGDHS